jgi:Mn2+/Fe2+ NRAMP family transporter
VKANRQRKGFSNLIALAIILTTGATLHEAGVFDVQTSAQAAEALKPIAGEFAFILFALGIVGTGLLAIPILAASGAYAIGEAFRWPTGLSRRPSKAPAFYGTLTAAVVGVAVTSFAFARIPCEAASNAGAWPNVPAPN